jgi:hypothetical protein
MQQRQHSRDGGRRSSGAQRGGAPITVPAHPVHQLQGQIGNAATGRILSMMAARPPAKRSLQRFNEAEHRALGDLALDAKFRLPAGTMFQELQLSFGDWVALGDYFEDIEEIKSLLKPGPARDRAGEVYYAVLVKIRPRNKAERAQVLKSYKDSELWTQADIDAVEQRYIHLAARNVKHFPNPLVGDTTRPTADKVGRERDGKPLGGIARYHHDHLDAVRLAMSAGELREERYLGEAYAKDGFACHFLTDAFSGSHVRTPRASIKDWWDAKVPHFDDTLLSWMTDEVAYVVETEPDTWKEWIGAAIDQLDVTRRYAVIRNAVRQKIAPKLPPTSFGDLISLIVHDWEGEHGPDGHGPLVTVAGQRFRTVGDGNLLKAVTSLKGKTPSEAELEKMLKHKGSAPLDDAQRTLAAAELAVRRSVSDLQRAYERARRGDRRDVIMGELQGKDGLFASERLIPTAVPDAELSEADRMPKWDYATVDEVLNAPKLHEQLPITAKSLAGRFDVNSLPGSAGVKAHIAKTVVSPLTSGKADTIIAWLHQVLAYSSEDLPRRVTNPRAGLGQDLRDLAGTRR